MDICLSPINYKNALNLLENKHIILYIGIKNFSMNTYTDITISQIEELSSKFPNRIVVVLNKFFFEQEINDVVNLIKKIIKFKIAGISFNDYAICQICYELKSKIPLIYNSYTMNTNYGQLDFFIKNNISKIQLCAELDKNKVFEICKNKKNLKIQIQVAGYVYMMHSRWSLLSTFAKTYKIKEKITNKKMYISEQKREVPCLIYEDDIGTSIFTSYSLNLLPYIKLLEKNKIDSLYIETFMHDENWINNISSIFCQALDNKNIKANIANIIKLDKTTSPGFFEMSRDSLVYLSNEIKLQWDND